MNNIQNISPDRVSGIIRYAVDKLKDGIGLNDDISDLHNILYNEDYFIIGVFNAQQYLGSEAFDAIGIIKEFEEENFGKVSTDLSSPENVVNMLAYLIGEELLSECETYTELMVEGELLTQDHIDCIIKELEAQL